MTLARITSKGQVTIPVEVRRTLDLHEGDQLLFETPRKDGVRLRVLRRRRLTELGGVLAAKRSYTSKAEARETVGRSRGEELLDQRHS